MKERLVIVGSGPAAWTAALYAARANLEALGFEGGGSRTMIPGVMIAGVAVCVLPVFMRLPETAPSVVAGKNAGG